KMLTGAGADRMQSGMQKAFGRPIGLAAQVKEQQPIFTVYVDNKDLEFARETLKKAFSRLPCTCKVV
nr:ribosomal protein L16 [Candidatus Woesearchaeota archaeon]